MFAERQRLKATLHYGDLNGLYAAELARTGDPEAAREAKMQALTALQLARIEEGVFK